MQARWLSLSLVNVEKSESDMPAVILTIFQLISTGKKKPDRLTARGRSKIRFLLQTPVYLAPEAEPLWKVICVTSINFTESSLFWKRIAPGD